MKKQQQSHSKEKLENPHILWNPNKNYLGHWDITTQDDLILTIQKISWDDIENPTTKEIKTKRVVRFVEDVKPLICNEENANAIFRVCKTELINDYEGKNFKIGLYTKHGKWFGEEREAIRVRDTIPIARKKEVLDENHPKWEKAKENVQNGSIDLDGLQKHWEVSQVIFLKLQEV